MYWLRRTRTARVVVAATSDTTPTTTAETGDLDGPDRLGRLRGAGLVLMLRRRPWARSTASGDCIEIGSLRKITTAPALACLQPCHTRAWFLVSVPACAPRVCMLTPSARIGAQFSSGAGCPTLIPAFRSTLHCPLWSASAGLTKTQERRVAGSRYSEELHGLIVDAPIPEKSERFLVTIVRPCASAVAAIRESKAGNNLPTRCPLATSEAHRLPT